MKSNPQTVLLEVGQEVPPLIHFGNSCTMRRLCASLLGMDAWLRL